MDDGGELGGAAGEALRKMEAEGVPRTGEPSAVARARGSGAAAAAASEEEEEGAEGKREASWPELSARDFQVYNRMAEHMDLFHNHFRQTWNTLFAACTANKRPAGMSIRQFLTTGLDFCHHLTTHHTIEERHIFPVLARKMDCFRKEHELLTQHKEIHEGLDKFEGYLNECKASERVLDLRELKSVMEAFGSVLWTHLDAEVKALGAENMRRYWTLDEMRRMPM